MTLPENTLQELLELFINARYVREILTDYNRCENIGGKNMEHTDVQELKLLMLHNQWDMLLTMA